MIVLDKLLYSKLIFISSRMVFETIGYSTGVPGRYKDYLVALRAKKGHVLGIVGLLGRVQARR